MVGEGKNQGHEFDLSEFFYILSSFILCHLIHPQWDVVRIMQNQWLSPQHAKTKWIHLPVNSYPRPITCYQGLFKSLIAFNPDEHWLRSIVTHLQPLVCTRAYTHSRIGLEIIAAQKQRWRNFFSKGKRPAHRETSGWPSDEQKAAGRLAQTMGQPSRGAGPLIKRIIWWCSTPGRSCPWPEIEYSNETHHRHLSKAKREKRLKRT